MRRTRSALDAQREGFTMQNVKVVSVPTLTVSARVIGKQSKTKTRVLASVPVRFGSGTMAHALRLAVAR